MQVDSVTTDLVSLDQLKEQEVKARLRVKGEK